MANSPIRNEIGGRRVGGILRVEQLYNTRRDVQMKRADFFSQPCFLFTTHCAEYVVLFHEPIQLRAALSALIFRARRV